MKFTAAALVVVFLGACNSGPAAPPAKLWTTRDFLNAHGKDVDFGGWLPSELIALEGEPIAFRSNATQTGGPGLTFFPGVADGVPATFVITEIWSNHPQPWVEPVWAPFDENLERPGDVLNIFPVDLDSTFYTPFWRAELLITPNGLTGSTYRDARDVLNAKGIERRIGPLLICPFVPKGLVFADDGTGLRDPMTLGAVTLSSGPRKGWVDGEERDYYDFGPRVRGDGDAVFSSDFYVFVKSDGERPLPLAAVLPSEPMLSALVNRIDVPLPTGAAPFVPDDRPELRAMLEARGVTAPSVRASLNRFTPYTLRVATNPECFDAVDFPTSCDWLDSAARLRRLAPSQLIRRPVQLALGVAIPPEVTP